MNQDGKISCNCLKFYAKHAWGYAIPCEGDAALILRMKCRAHATRREPGSDDGLGAWSVPRSVDDHWLVCEADVAF